MVISRQINGKLMLALEDEALKELGIGSAISRARLKVLMARPYESESRCFYHFPVINIFYDMFMDEPPPSAALKEMLNLEGLLAALLFSTGIAVPANFEYDELEEARIRLNSEPYNTTSVYVEDGLGDGMVNKLMVYTAFANYALGLVVISTIVTLVVVANIEDTLYKDFDARQVWWKYMRWVIIVSTVILIFGIYYTFKSFRCLVYLKFPDLPLEVPDTHYDDLWSTHDTYFWGAHGVVLGGIIVLTILSGWAQRSGYQVMHGNKLLFEYCSNKMDTKTKPKDDTYEESIREFAGVARPPPNKKVVAGVGAGATDSAVAC